ncbi:30S ribosome-binding factor RbfA [Brachybacterium sp. AOP25-B2-12]|uniref:30S ribosome-binding factor RbfA n=1 Tax=Brachybacterium sp. AOP25-B2-12 TaxID=3457710 RepID=UPI00403405D9
MPDSPRARRLADRIQQIVATTIDTRVKDPRLGFVTVTDVRVTGDLQHATVFYTVFGDDEAREGTAAALRSATGMLRSEVGRQIGVRLTPTLEFIADALPENALTIEDLLVVAQHRDADLARSKEGAAYAGEEDPYRVPREDADLEDSDPDADGTDTNAPDAEAPDDADALDAGTDGSPTTGASGDAGPDRA